MTTKVWLKNGRDSALLRRHPWVFSGAISHVEGDAGAGHTVEVCDHQGNFLGWGGISPSSSIRVRVWSFNEAEKIDTAFFQRRLKNAIGFRKAMPSLTLTNARRLVNAESDGLPGLIVDQYDQVLVAQFLTQGAEYWKPVIIEHLAALTGVCRIYERSDEDVRKLENLPLTSGWLREPWETEQCEIDENGLKFLVDFGKGHKTGFYLDQRDARHAVGELVAGRNVLNCFSYTGAFSVIAMKHGAAHVTSVDSSAPALALGAQNAALNGVTAGIDWVEADVFQYLREQRDRGLRYDMVILDPPKFAATAVQVEKAARAYKDINLLAFKLLSPGGLLVTFSCSGGVTADLFQKIVADAALDAGKDAKILGALRQAGDHPVGLAFPEAAYLKGLICSV